MHVQESITLWFLCHMDVTSQRLLKTVANANTVLFCIKLCSSLKTSSAFLCRIESVRIKLYCTEEERIFFSDIYVWYNMNRLMNALPARISFLAMVFLTSFRAQMLYETDYQQYSNLNREGKEVSVQSLLKPVLRKRRLIYKNLLILRKMHTIN